MKAWEIWSYQPAGWPEPHPAVIVSGPARVAHKPELNIIMCSTKEATRPPFAKRGHSGHSGRAKLADPLQVRPFAPGGQGGPQESAWPRHAGPPPGHHPHDDPLQRLDCLENPPPSRPPAQLGSVVSFFTRASVSLLTPGRCRFSLLPVIRRRAEHGSDQSLGGHASSN